MTTTMRAAVFGGRGHIGIREVPRPEPGVGEALGPGVTGYAPGERVIAGAITP
jgi:hypothetical protein